MAIISIIMEWDTIFCFLRIYLKRWQAQWKRELSEDWALRNPTGKRSWSGQKIYNINTKAFIFRAKTWRSSTRGSYLTHNSELYQFSPNLLRGLTQTAETSTLLSLNCESIWNVEDDVHMLLSCFTEGQHLVNLFYLNVLELSSYRVSAVTVAQTTYWGHTVNIR